jgi:capsular polysaccharide biosynthesis protein
LDEVVVPTRIKYARTTHQKQILGALRITDNGASRKNEADMQILYIGRRPGMVRAVTNEENLVTCLTAQFPGFRRIYLEDMSFTDQIVSFRNANIIIAPHGGGLTNILFCRSGTGVIEFHLPDTGIMYWHLSIMQQLRYLAYVPESYDPTTLHYVIQPGRLVAAIAAMAEMAPFDLDSLSRA